MFSTFTKFSANNIDRINRAKGGKEDSGSELDFNTQLEKAGQHLGELQNLDRIQKAFGQQDKKKDSLLSKVLGGDTNQMIFGAMVFAFLVIVTMAVVASGAGPLAVGAMGVFATGFGGALVAKAVKKFRNTSKSQDSIASQTSSTLKHYGKELQKSLKNELGVGKEEDGKTVSSLFSPISAGSKISPLTNKAQMDELKKELTKEVTNSLNINTIEEKEKKLKSEITDLQGRFYGNLKKVMGDDKFCNLASPHDHIPEETGEVLKKLLNKGGLKAGADISPEAAALKDIMKDYDRKGLKEQKLVLKTLNDIFDKCDDSSGAVADQPEASKKKLVLANIIKKDSSSVDATKKDEVKGLIKAQKEKFDEDKVSKSKKDLARQQQKTNLGMKI